MTRTLLSLAAFTLLTGGAAAAQDTIRIPVGDLDLSTRAGATAFDARVAAEARAACTLSRWIPNPVCVRQIQREALRQLPQSRRDDYVRARRGVDIQAQVAPAWLA